MTFIFGCPMLFIWGCCCWGAECGSISGPGGLRMGPAWPGGPPMVLFLLSACLRGKHTGQSCRLQCFQWAMICLEDAQCGTVHVLSAWHDPKWFSTFFIVLQWGSVHCTSVICSRSLCWHLCACNNRTSCCCINFRLFGSAEWAGDFWEILGTPRNPGTLFVLFEMLCMCVFWLQLVWLLLVRLMTQ